MHLNVYYWEEALWQEAECNIQHYFIYCSRTVQTGCPAPLNPMLETSSFSQFGAAWSINTLWEWEWKGECLRESTPGILNCLMALIIWHTVQAFQIYFINWENNEYRFLFITDIRMWQQNLKLFFVQRQRQIQ